MVELNFRQVASRCRLRTKLLEGEALQMVHGRNSFPHARALVLLIVVNVHIVVQRSVPIDAACHELVVSTNRFRGSLDDDDSESFGDYTDA